MSTDPPDNPPRGRSRKSSDVAARIRAGRKKRQATLARTFRALRDRYTEHTLDKLSRMGVDDPGFLQYLQQRGELAELTLALMLSRREQRRWSPSQDEIVSLIDRVTDKTEGVSRYKARKRVAKMLGMREAAVKQADNRARKRIDKNK